MAPPTYHYRKIAGAAVSGLLRFVERRADLRRPAKRWGCQYYRIPLESSTACIGSDSMNGGRS